MEKIIQYLPITRKRHKKNLDTQNAILKNAYEHQLAQMESRITPLVLKLTKVTLSESHCDNHINLYVAISKSLLNHRTERNEKVIIAQQIAREIEDRILGYQLK